jgi:hypothetical protein
MKKAIFTAAIMAASISANAAPWYEEGEFLTGSKLKDGLWIGMNTAIVIDWAQTRYIADNPDRFIETNNVLGPHPTTGEVNAYFVKLLAFQNGVYYFLPENLKPVWTTGALVYWVDLISDNREIGIRMQF